jgi:hypothetical protein
MWLHRLINKIFKINQNESQNSKVKGQNLKLKVKNSEQEVQEQTELESINARLTKLEADLGKAIGGYRQALLSQNPDILPEMIVGGSIEELDRSLSSAKDLTARIREKLEQKTAAERIPGGAPPRTLPDTSSLSSHEKIVYGLEQK